MVEEANTFKVLVKYCQILAERTLCESLDLYRHCSPTGHPLVKTLVKILAKSWPNTKSLVKDKSSPVDGGSNAGHQAIAGQTLV